MRAFLLFLCLSSCGSTLLAQQFHYRYSINLPDSLVKVQMDRVDLNNDGLLDVLLISQAASGHSYLMIVKGDTTITPFLHWQTTRTIGPLKSFVVTDYDNDNRLDVVMSSTAGKVAVYLNRGGFVFAENLINVPPFSTLLMTDLDDDARREWIISDHQSAQRKLMVFRQTGAFTWQLAHDSLAIAATSLAVTDQNYDGRPDVFVSGTASADSVASTVLVSDGKLRLVPGSAFPFVGNSAAADVNADGIFDVVVMGADQNGVSGTRLYRSGGGTHSSADLSIPLANGVPFAADMNSDGIVDHNFWGRRGADTLNIVQYSSTSFDTIPSTRYRAHVFGDEDRDGDLDLVVAVKTTRIQLLGYRNMTAVNRGPSTPKTGLMLPVFNRIFFYWEPSTDDHTPQRSITYDLYIDGTQSFAGEFDLLNEKRLSVTHGNNGTQNFKLVRNVRASSFAVQAVDNSFHAGKPCIGSGSTGCTPTVEKVLLCIDETTTLRAPAEVLWFSFLKGYLGKQTTVELSASSDTVFYYDPAAKGCGGLKVWSVAVSNNAVRKVGTRYSCAGQSLRLEVEPSWASVSWRSHLRGVLGAGAAINYTASTVSSDVDTVTATMSTASGCIRRDKFIIKISAPQVTVSPTHVRMAAGASVQLVAGGADQYQWQPTDGLSAANIATPLASPAVTTTYIVTGYDSLQCSATAQSVVTIESGGFIPNLFTPNNDGKNDEIRIYGLTEVHDFVFTIHNREGSLVYRTNSLNDATQKGWDGTRQGTHQPAGVYYWKVKGELPSGERLLLNGKDSGSIVLVR